MHRPPSWRPSRRLTPARRWSSARTRRRASRDGSSLTSLNPARTRFVGAESRSATAMRAVSAASTGYIARSSEKAGPGHVLGRVQVSHSREPHLPLETAREQSNARRKASPSFGAGGWIRSPFAAPGQAVVPATVPLRSLDAGSSVACYQSLYSLVLL